MRRNELLQSFCDCSENRTGFNHPFLQGKYVIGTDAHVALLLPREEVDSTLYEKQDKPNMQLLIGGEKKPLMEISTKDLVAAFRELKDKIDNIDRRCQECKGSGTVEYHYWDRFSDLHTKDLDCPICHGNGERDIHDFFSKKRYQYIINDKHSLTYPTMRHIMELIDYFNLEKVTLLQQVCPLEEPFHIIDDRFHMVLAPALYNHDDDDDEED